MKTPPVLLQLLPSCLTRRCVFVTLQLIWAQIGHSVQTVDSPCSAAAAAAAAPRFSVSSPFSLLTCSGSLDTVLPIKTSRKKWNVDFLLLSVWPSHLCHTERAMFQAQPPKCVDNVVSHVWKAQPVTSVCECCPAVEWSLRHLLITHYWATELTALNDNSGFGNNQALSLSVFLFPFLFLTQSLSPHLE